MSILKNIIRKNTKYISNYKISPVGILLLANMGVILTLIMVLLELKQMRKLRKSSKHLFGKTQAQGDQPL